MTEPTIRVLSLGAGVQSTTLALLAIEGVLPKPDAAVFGDTGWEPKAVYETLDRLDRSLTAVGVPLYRVGRGGSIRDDVLDRSVFATLPAYVVTEKKVREPLTWRLCDCDWAALHRAGCTLDAIEALTVPLDALPDVEAAGQARSETLRAASLPCVPPPCPACRLGRVVVSWHTYTQEVHSMIMRQCTGKYKIEPVEQKIRELLGARVREVACGYCIGTGMRVAPWDREAGMGTCSVCRGSGVRRLVSKAPRGRTAEQWIGFSTDELDRVTTAGFPRHATPRHPLIELGWSRTDCEVFLADRGWKVAKSACIGCPFHRNAFWRDMRDNRPEEWADAVAFDKAFRTAPGLNGRRYLHESCLPLDEAPIDRLTIRETAATQVDLLDLIVPGDSPVQGCSPYGCRSGKAVTS